MSVLQLLYQLFFAPLELLFEFVFSVAYGVLDNIGISLIPLSLAVNFLLLPFYNRADAIQKEQHAIEERLAPGIAHIKKTFQGDERYMIMQTFYRQNHYSPIQSLRSSLAILLEIPFFIAAYHFLSHYTLMSTASLGPLQNLGEPDKLLKLGSLSVNLLPILMTVINIISSSIYAKDLSLKEKVQLHGMALIFLVLLYNSPSGLVFYWTLNNLFSLVKNIVYTSKNKALVLDIILGVMSLITLIFGLVFRGKPLGKLAIIVVAIAMVLPILIRRSELLQSKAKKKKDDGDSSSINRIFVFACLFLAMLTGLLIPASVIASSPAEFVIQSSFRSPVRYVIYSSALAIGLFVIWCGLFYYLSSARVRNYFCICMCILSISGVIHFFCFGRQLSYLDNALNFEFGLNYGLNEVMISPLVFIALIVLIVVLFQKKLDRVIRFILPVLLLGTTGLGIYNVVNIQRQMPAIRQAVELEAEKLPSIPLSRNGQNVVVIMMDRALSCYVPYLFQEKPELEEMFSGFTWYPNTLSFGTTTNTGSPALFGGYDYQPLKLNERDDTLLKDKQNEALRLMPVLFDEAGYNVTVCDPPYAGYQWIPDLSIYDDHPDIHAYITENGQFWNEPKSDECSEHIWIRDFFCYSITRIVPVPFQEFFYNSGTYRDPNHVINSLYRVQYAPGDSLFFGYDANFMNAYSALMALPSITEVSDSSENTFLMLQNSTTHNVANLKEPEYVPAMSIDNREYDQEHADRFTVDGRTISMDSVYKMAHYQSDMAGLLGLGQWFDYLRSEGLWDNTRIIIVSDHGYMLDHFEDLSLPNNSMDTGANVLSVLSYNPLFMVKDFGSTDGFTVDYTFMTNADTPLLAFDQLIENPVHPDTGVPVTDALKYEDTLYVMHTEDWRTNSNNGTRFTPGIWYSVRNQYIFDPENWKEEGVK